MLLLLLSYDLFLAVLLWKCRQKGIQCSGIDVNFERLVTLVAAECCIFGYVASCLTGLGYIARGLFVFLCFDDGFRSVYMGGLRYSWVEQRTKPVEANRLCCPCERERGQHSLQLSNLLVSRFSVDQLAGISTGGWTADDSQDSLHVPLFGRVVGEGLVSQLLRHGLAGCLRFFSAAGGYANACAWCTPARHRRNGCTGFCSVSLSTE